MPELDVAGMSISNGEEIPELQTPGTCKERCIPETQDGTIDGKSDTSGRTKLRSWLNKQMRIEMSDGRILVGIFLCTDRDGNVILGSCTEYISPEVWGFSDEPRMLGLVMVPGKHIVTVHHDSSLSSYSSQDAADPPQSASHPQCQSASAQTQTHIPV